jgi:hypothetical protein
MREEQRDDRSQATAPAAGISTNASKEKGRPKAASDLADS